MKEEILWEHMRKCIDAINFHRGLIAGSMGVQPGGDFSSPYVLGLAAGYSTYTPSVRLPQIPSRQRPCERSRNQSTVEEQTALSAREQLQDYDIPQMHLPTPSETIERFKYKFPSRKERGLVSILRSWKFF